MISNAPRKPVKVPDFDNTLDRLIERDRDARIEELEQRLDTERENTGRQAHVVDTRLRAGVRLGRIVNGETPRRG